MFLNQETTINRSTFAYHFFFDKRYRSKAKDINAFTDLLFNAFDLNSNGRLSFIEFLIGKHLFESDSKKNNLKFLFRLFDMSHDQKIEKKEIEEFLIKLGQLGLNKTDNHAEFAQQMINDLDFDHNGSIDENEFIEGILKNEKYNNFIDSIFVFTD